MGLLLSTVVHRLLLIDLTVLVFKAPLVSIDWWLPLYWPHELRFKTAVVTVTRVQ